MKQGVLRGLIPSRAVLRLMAIELQCEVADLLLSGAKPESGAVA